MYLVMVIVLMVALPVLSVASELVVFHGGDVLVQVGRWFVFWAVGVRLLAAGLRQTIDPTFTAKTIFAIGDPAARRIVRELGFGNLAIGLIGMLALVNSGWIVPAAIAGGVFYGLASLRHVRNRDRTRTETIAMVSGLFAAGVIAAWLVAVLVGRLAA